MDDLFSFKIVFYILHIQRCLTHLKIMTASEGKQLISHRLRDKTSQSNYNYTRKKKGRNKDKNKIYRK